MNLSLNVEEDYHVMSIDPEHAVGLIEEGLKMIDVRTDDFKGGNIPNSENIPYTEFEDKLEDIVSDLEDGGKVLILCMHGKQRSRQGALQLLKTAREMKK